MLGFFYEIATVIKMATKRKLLRQTIATFYHLNQSRVKSHKYNHFKNDKGKLVAQQLIFSKKILKLAKKITKNRYFSLFTARTKLKIA